MPLLLFWELVPLPVMTSFISPFLPGQSLTFPWEQGKNLENFPSSSDISRYMSHGNLKFNMLKIELVLFLPNTPHSSPDLGVPDHAYAVLPVIQTSFSLSPYNVKSYRFYLQFLTSFQLFCFTSWGAEMIFIDLYSLLRALYNIWYIGDYQYIFIQGISLSLIYR